MSQTIRTMRRTWRRGAVLSVLLLPLLAGGFLGIRWASYNLPIFSFVPACRDYSPAENFITGFDDVHFIWGEPTEEFWQELAAFYDEWKQEYPEGWASRRDFRFANGELYVTLSYFFPLEEAVAKFYLEPAASAYHTTSALTYRIYQRRLAEGRFEGIDMSPYTVNRGFKKRPMMAPMKHDECGFMEELILEGGRFAGPLEEAVAPAAEVQ